MFEPFLSTSQQPCILVDYSHCHRYVTGFERIALEQFSNDSLAPLPLKHIHARSRISMLWEQNIHLPFLLARNPNYLLLCPGFPPGLLTHSFSDRVIPYIHDVFPLTRQAELRLRARLYIGSLLRLALSRFPLLMVNSLTTAHDIKPFCPPQSEVMIYRPEVRNIFKVDPASAPRDSLVGDELRLLALGTLEPRKNLLSAAKLLQAIRAHYFPQARLDIVGRIGWGEDAKKLKSFPGVFVHGYQDEESVRHFLYQSHALINTSHAEGLGLPLLEVQHSGLLVIARDLPIFREVLGTSGVFIDIENIAQSAEKIAAVFKLGDFLSASSRAVENVQRWNELARGDRQAILLRLSHLLNERGQPSC